MVRHLGSSHAEYQLVCQALWELLLDELPEVFHFCSQCHPVDELCACKARGYSEIPHRRRNLDAEHIQFRRLTNHLGLGAEHVCEGGLQDVHAASMSVQRHNDCDQLKKR